MQYFFCLFLILVRPFVQFCSLLTKLYDILRGNSHWPYSLTKYFTFTIVWTSTCLVSFPGPISFASSVSWLLWTEPTGWILHQLCKVFIRPVARVGSGDPVRVLRLYTTNTLDEVCSIYCWDICTTCRYRSTCYSTGTSGPTALSVCSRLCLVANCSLSSDWLTARSLTRCSLLLSSRTVLYGAFYSYLCRRYWNGILGPSTFDVICGDFWRFNLKFSQTEGLNGFCYFIQTLWIKSLNHRSGSNPLCFTSTWTASVHCL